MLFTTLALRAPLSRALSTGAAKHKVVFLGTPDVAKQSLEQLLAAAAAAGDWEVSAVVTQPPSLMGRGKKRALTPSAVHQLAESHGIPVMAPERARDEAFLEALEELAPDLCVTAAYGQFLPKRFLAIPRLGTLNVHPSLLPRWRGASPVQRSLEAGDTVGGVSVVWTVLKMDAGPIADQYEEPYTGDEKTPEVLDRMFEIGTQRLVELLPKVWTEECTPATSAKQDKNKAVPADKISPDEAEVCFAVDSAATVHNRVRGFAGWPGVWSNFEMQAKPGDDGTAGAWDSAQRIKIITTKVASAEDLASASAGPGAEGDADCALLRFTGKGRLFVPCAEGTVLEVLELQMVNKKVTDARSFVNGLRGRAVRWVPRPPPAETDTEEPAASEPAK